MRGRVAFSVALGACLVVTLAFLLIPVLAIFLRVPPSRLLNQLGSGVATDALIVTLKTNAIAQGLILLVGTPAAYLVGRHRFPGRGAVITLVELPLVLPPAVAGIGLLAAFGRFGLLGGTLSSLGIEVGLTQTAVVLAVAYVASPFYLRQAIAAFEGLDGNVLDASRTLGAGPARTFARVALPLARAGLAAGAALSFARGIGEFGATIMFAGSLRGVTQTLSLAVYSEFDVDFEVALALSALLVVISAALLVTLKWLPSLSTSRFRFATSS
jgi:molybdate transport system permease protein